jgi:hypothetical protein
MNQNARLALTALLAVGICFVAGRALVRLRTAVALPKAAPERPVVALTVKGVAMSEPHPVPAPFSGTPLFLLEREVTEHKPYAGPSPTIEIALQGIVYSARGSQVIIAGQPYAEGAAFVSSGSSVKVVAIAPGKVKFELAGTCFERELAPVGGQGAPSK